ncbi:T6SS phospholipase effector Tle1-like catalytic domain-containing protein [Xanthomonas sp. 60]
MPRLVDSGNPHERLFIAAFDGTGNNFHKDPLHATNVARIFKQLEDVEAEGDPIFIRYLEGPGTQSNPITRTVDAALGHTYEERLEQMYADLADKAKEWRQADPEVQIRVFSTGFSRGASQAAGFTNLLHERGIVDLASRAVDANGRTIYTRHIAAPGLTPQAVGLFDPVATGIPERFDRRLAPSVVSGLQITALDETRVRFPSDQVIPPGASADGRFLNLQVAGAHSDIGGGYLRDGLAIRSCNLMTDYCNALRPGAPLLEKVHEPSDPRLNVVHRSHEGMVLFQVDRQVDRATPEGVNARLAPDRLAAADALAHAPKPVSRALERGPLDRVSIGLVPSEAGDLAMANLRRIEAAEAAGIRPASGATKLARSLSHGAAVVTTGVEAVSVAHDYSQLRNQGNLTAARATVSRSASTGAGTWLGFEAGMAVGSPLGPGALATGAVGAVIGGVAGDKLADAMEHRRIYTQRGSDGNTWQADPTHPEQGWRRQTLPPLPSSPQGQYAIASPALADELNYKAVAKATELGMAAATARDPFKLPASSADGFSGYGGDWRRNPANGEWQRQINYDKPGLGHTETAAPERAQQLDSQSRQIVADNAARSPAALAAAFSVLYAQNNWQAHGKLPEAVDNNLAHPQRVTASDGLTYDRNANGQWTHDGVFWNSHADGNLRTELELAVVAQREHVQKLMHPGRGPEPATPTLETVRVTPSPEQQAEGPHVAPAPVTPDDPDKARSVSMEHQSPQGPHGAAHHARDEGTPRRLADLRPGHPSHALYAQIAEGVSKLDAAHGRSFDETSERLTASLLVRASESGLSRVDHVLLNMQTAKVAAGEKVFLVQGDPSDPLHKRVTMATMEALQTPVEVSLAQLPAAEEQGRHVAAMQMDQQAVTMQAQPLQMG